MKACEEYLEKDEATITDPKSFRDGWRKALEFAYKKIATYEDNGILASDQVRVTFTDELYGGSK